jgi:hypothetical protein
VDDLQADLKNTLLDSFRMGDAVEVSVISADIPKEDGRSVDDDSFVMINIDGVCAYLIERKRLPMCVTASERICEKVKEWGRETEKQRGAGVGEA